MSRFPIRDMQGPLMKQANSGRAVFHRPVWQQMLKQLIEQRARQRLHPELLVEELSEVPSRFRPAAAILILVICTECGFAARYQSDKDFMAASRLALCKDGGAEGQ